MVTGTANINTEKRVRYSQKNQEDKELIRKWQQEKDILAGDTFVLKYNYLIYNILSKYPKIPMEEAVSEGFYILKMCMNCYNINKDTPFSTYFITAYRNKLNVMSRKRIYNQNSFDLDQDLENFQDKKQTEVFENIEQKLELESILKDLSDLEKDILIGFYENSESLEKLAKRTGFSKKEIQNILKNIMENLKREVA